MNYSVAHTSSFGKHLTSKTVLKHVFPQYLFHDNCDNRVNKLLTTLNTMNIDDKCGAIYYNSSLTHYQLNIYKK